MDKHIYYEIKYKDGRPSDYCPDDTLMIKFVNDLYYECGLVQGEDFDVIERERV